MKRIFANRAWVATALVSLSAVVFSGCGDTAPVGTTSSLPPKLSHRIRLSVTNANELEHWVIYKSDNVSKTLEQIEYQDGVTTLFYFGSDNFATRMVEYYPAASPDGKRQMKSEVYYKPRSSDFSAHQAYLKDGTLVKVGKRLFDGNYRTLTYFDDGVKLQKVQFFSFDKFMLSQTVYRKNGAKSQVTTTNPSRDTFVWNYDEKGKLWMMYELPSLTWMAPGGKFYRLDGRAVKAEFKMYELETNITYFDERERETFEISFKKEEKEMLVLAIHARSGNPLYEQRWRHVSGKFDCTGKFELLQTSEYAHGSVIFSRQAKREIIMSPDGRYVRQIRILTNPEVETQGVDYFLYPSGFLESKRNFVKDTIVTRAKNFADGVSKEKVIQVDSQLINYPSLECLALPDIKLPEGQWSQ